MDKKRREVVEGIRASIRIMKLQPRELSEEEAIVYYGQDDKVTLEEAREVLGSRRKAA